MSEKSNLHHKVVKQDLGWAHALNYPWHFYHNKPNASVTLQYDEKV